MSAIEQAARAVLARWDSPQWDWNAEGPTADLMHALRAALDAGQAQPVSRDREADRQRFTDPAFNRWLDEGISDAGHTVWDAVGDVQAAWNGWSNREFYTSPPAHQPLTDEQIADACSDLFVGCYESLDEYDAAIARAIERAHGIGATP